MTRVSHVVRGRNADTPEFRVSPVDRARAATRAPTVGAPRRGGRQEARRAPGGRAPSWHYAKHVSAHLDPAADIRVSRRHVRHAQREVLWAQSSLERVRKCGRVTIGGTGHVLIRTNAGVAHYAGLATCGSIWACPVCSGKIRTTRAAQISTATAAWDQLGNSVYMMTFTAPHDLGMRLKPLLSAIADGFRAVISGRAWTKLRKQLGIVGTIRSMEVTHGANGWHPHLHVLVYIEGQADAADLTALTLHARRQWARFITGAGYRVPHDRHGVDVQRCASAYDAGVYIAKTQDGRAVGNELARGDLKQGRHGGRTPFEVLDDFRWTGDAEDLALWREYELATKGRQAITWSKGLKKLLSVDDRNDEEIAAEEVGGADLAVIQADTWRTIVQVPGLAALILDRAETGGLQSVNGLLSRRGIAPAAPPGALRHLE